MISVHSVFYLARFHYFIIFLLPNHYLCSQKMLNKLFSLYIFLWNMSVHPIFTLSSIWACSCNVPRDSLLAQLSKIWLDDLLNTLRTSIWHYHRLLMFILLLIEWIQELWHMFGDIPPQRVGPFWQSVNTSCCYMKIGVSAWLFPIQKCFS